MLVEITNHNHVIDVMPCIDKYNRYMVTVDFDNGEGFAYSFADKESFLTAYRDLIGRVDV